ncbi:MAG: hypothetical protein GTN39_03630 [Candidatus Aenigmarchaeota archaeon]|nr:hypothetical protein [Candidatus Aenigmarchaeota archaeon]
MTGEEYFKEKLQDWGLKDIYTESQDPSIRNFVDSTYKTLEDTEVPKGAPDKMLETTREFHVKNCISGIDEFLKRAHRTELGQKLYENLLEISQKNMENLNL